MQLREFARSRLNVLAFRENAEAGDPSNIELASAIAAVGFAGVFTGLDEVDSANLKASGRELEGPGDALSFCANGGIISRKNGFRAWFKKMADEHRRVSSISSRLVALSAPIWLFLAKDDEAL
ncbi:hypothetical protein TEQG_01419 [Trichophyton equinum CBS 127.97]|uniref:Uncharacterized protein n=1 Tax=Trichophyton equinum (strain ATCC MYA-4606 / CBS 127.97) TaxID=559882 RepID=F2PKG4_TRIEC|nr:hypothetical protein TEQG_01419 [Trichophyton equinum CBS 127.97]